MRFERERNLPKLLGVGPKQPERCFQESWGEEQGSGSRVDFRCLVYHASPLPPPPPPRVGNKNVGDFSVSMS